MRWQFATRQQLGLRTGLAVVPAAGAAAAASGGKLGETTVVSGDADVRALYSFKRPCIRCSAGRDRKPTLSISCCIRCARTSWPRDPAAA